MTIWIEKRDNELIDYGVLKYNFNWKEEYGENVKVYGTIEIPMSIIITVLKNMGYDIIEIPNKISDSQMFNLR